MAGTDHGEVLTRFEEIFGSVVEHEVIKLILQSCEWDAATASDTLLGMIDKNNLPPHVLSALTADSIIRGLVRRQPASREPAEEHDMGPQVSPYPMLMTQGNPEANGPVASPSRDATQATNRSVTMSTIPDSTSEKSVITVHPSVSAFPSASPSTPNHTRVEERGGAGSPLSTSTTKSGESVSSSPSFSPLRLNNNVKEAGTMESSASQWVLAPQFVPNAFNFKSSDVGNKSGVWPPGMSSRLVGAFPSGNALPPQQEIRRSKKDEIIQKILHGTKIMVLMRGLPGSGKSSLARELKGATSGVVLSTDDFFCDKQGRYNYDSSKIGEAHQWNKHRTSQRLQKGRTPIIIDNTNLQRWEMKPYVKLALQYGYDVQLLDADTPWRLNVKDLSRKNSHGVPAKKIEEMKERYELNVEIEDMVAELQGIDLSKSSPSKNAASGVREVITLANDLTETEVTKCSLFKTPKQSSETNQNSGSAVPDNECNALHSSVEGEFEYESDEDVVVEGYDDDEEPSPPEIHIAIGTTSDGEILVTQSDQGITESNQDIKEATSYEHERLDNMNMSEETEEVHDKENVSSESLGSPIDLTHALLACCLKEEERTDQELPVDSKKMGDESDICATKLDSGPDACDETKIQQLLDEASKTIDVSKSEEEWDNLVSNISGDDFSDDKFNDLVTSFGTALKKQIENKESNGISDARDSSVATESFSEDSAMYDLISTMEDKTGQPLSTLLTKVAKEDGVTDLPLTENTGGETACNSVLSNTEPEIENMPGNITTLKLSENDTDIPSVSSETLPLDNDVEHVTKKELLAHGNLEEDKEDNRKLSHILSSEDSGHPLPEEVDGLFSQDDTHLKMGTESLVSWECVDIKSGVCSATWDSKSDNPNSDRDAHLSKPCRSQRNRMPGSPSKWLKEADVQNESVDEAIASWVAVDGTPQWDSSEPAKITPEPSPLKNGESSSKYLEVEEPQSHTGAVSKFRKHKRRSGSSSPNSRKSSKGGALPIVTVYQEPKITYTEMETQTLSIDFEALQLDHNLYELKVLFGRPHYVPVTTVSSSFSEKGPLTKGGLRLEKGTMTDNVYESSVSSFQNLVAFFPNIPKEDLRDVFEKCRYDSDWAMNVLLDSGYEMSDPNDVTAQETEEDIESDSVSEILTNTDEGKNDQSSCDTSDVAFDNFVDERTRKIRQSQQPDDLAKKLEIENSFAFPEAVDDRVLRLTGKQYSDLNMTKVKKNKSRKQHVKGSSPPSNTGAEDSVEEEVDGAQYVTLVMDPLFASQLNMMFGPVGDYEISGDLTFEDRSVVLPLEICEMIHKYWARTVNGKFKHEAEILDSLVRQDEILARKLQEEENAAFNLGDQSDDVANSDLLEDKPVCFQEIMDLEQALQESLAGKSTPEDTSISSVLNLKRLYKEYPHVDPVALKEEYTKNSFKYQNTVQKLNQRFGKEQGTPKTVIAPEALSRYEQEMIERAQQESVAEEEVPCNQHDEIVPDDPQVFRDEAQAHYHQRQEAFQKAQEASRRGMKAAAAYYAHIGNLHSEKLREANQRASQKILEAKNAHRKDANCLDLHLLHVPEARSATQAFLHERQRVLIARGIRQMEVSLITGRGAHSAGGQAVLKPAIKEHLQKNGYSFYEVNSGMLKVILRAKPS